MKKNSKAKKRYSPWIEGLMATFVGTLLSIILTFGINSCRESQQEKDDRHLAALMVLGNIETFARNLEVWQEENSPIDSACSIFLNLPPDEISSLSDDSLSYYINLLMDQNPTAISHDETAEKIFSNNIETWKNVGNAMFIQKIGQLFVAINLTREQLNSIGPQIGQFYQESMAANKGTVRDGNVAFLKSTGLRQHALNAHYAYVEYPNYIKAYLRYWNKKCMDLIGVTEDEINQHLSGLDEMKKEEEKEPKPEDFIK